MVGTARHRRSIRLKGYDYSQEGAYFITICTHNCVCLLAEVADEQVRLNQYGRAVEQEWMRTDIVRPSVVLDDYVVMPNHFHAILFLTDVGASRSSALLGAVSLSDGRLAGNADWGRATRRVAPTGPTPASIGAIVGQFKSLVTKKINALRGTPQRPVWQRNYYERVIRNEDELNRIREYVANNPLQWALDRENPQATAHAEIYEWLYAKKRRARDAASGAKG